VCPDPEGCVPSGPRYLFKSGIEFGLYVTMFTQVRNQAQLNVNQICAVSMNRFPREEIEKEG
jgi:hypothetical protein